MRSLFGDDDAREQLTKRSLRMRILKRAERSDDDADLDERIRRLVEL